MKNLIHILFLCVLIARLVSAQWFQQENGTNVNLNSVYFVDSLKGWIVGNDSTILHTSTGGSNWIQQSCGFLGYAKDLQDVFFINDTLGWAVGGTDYNGIILNTNNGGSNWVIQSKEITRLLNAVFFINDSVGWIGGGMKYPGGKIILKTTNKGLLWDTLLIETIPHNSIFDIKFVNDSIGWAVGGVYPGWGNIIMKTTDGGSNWITQLENYFYEPIASCDFISEQVGWITFAIIVINPVGIMNTIDGGINWNLQYMCDSLAWESLNSIIFVNNQKGWTAGFDQAGSRILHTTNGGLQWEPQNVSTTVALNSIFFINEYKGWAVGNSGTILYTNNGGETFTENEIADEVINSFYLFQNYPNPFNPSTKIFWQSPVGSWQTLKIYDVLGNEVATLVDEYKPAGKYEFEFEASSLTSGVYFYQLKADEYINTKKMVLLK